MRVRRILATHDCWYKQAIAYCLHVRFFRDADGGGVGDFARSATQPPEIHTGMIFPRAG